MTQQNNIPDPENPPPDGEPEGGAPAPEAPQPQADGSDERIAALQAELGQAKDQMLRAMAEAENTRKRLLREREDVRKYAVSDFARDMLDFSDNFRRALTAIPEDLKALDERIKGVIEGIEAMEKEVLRAFEKHGIKKIEPLGELFNPNFHEVMFEAPGTGKPAGTITQLIEPGYMLHDRLLRPARVGVAKDEGQGNGGGSPGGRVNTEV